MAKKTTGKALVKWADKFAAIAKQQAKGVDVGGVSKYISIRKGQLTFNGEKIKNNTMRIIIIAHVRLNTYYEPGQKFDESNPQSPICWAYGETKEDQAPEDNVPEKQSDECSGCQWNVFGSGGGNAKACKNTYKLLVLPEDAFESGVDMENLATLSVPPTSLKAYGKYVKELETLVRPLWSVITEIELDGFELKFKLGEELEDEDAFQALEDLSETATDNIRTPFSAREKTETPKGKAAVKPQIAPKNNKFAARR